MKSLIAKIVLAGLIASSAMPLQAFWGTKTTVVLKAKHGQNSFANQFAQKLANGLTYIKDSIYNASTETKLLVGCAALATAGISYLLYRHLNPTDQELCDAAAPYIREAQALVETMPTATPVNQNDFDGIGGLLSAQNFAVKSLAEMMSRSCYSLRKQRDILHTRIAKYDKAGQIAHEDNLYATRDQIDRLIKNLNDRIYTLRTHAHYFRLVGLECAINTRYTRAIAFKSDARALVPVVRVAESRAQFPFLSFVENISDKIQSVANELTERIPSSGPLDIYTKKRQELRNTNEDLRTVRATVWNSQEYTNDENAKRDHDKHEAEMTLKRQRLAQEAQKADDERWTRQQELIIKRQELQLKQEKAARERQAYQQQHPNGPIVVQQVNAGCEVQ